MTIKGETVLTGAEHPGTEIEIIPRFIDSADQQQCAWYYLGFRGKDGFPFSRETDYMSLSDAMRLLSLIRKAR